MVHRVICYYPFTRLVTLLGLQSNSVLMSSTEHGSYSGESNSPAQLSNSGARVTRLGASNSGESKGQCVRGEGETREKVERRHSIYAMLEGGDNKCGKAGSARRSADVSAHLGPDTLNQE